MREGQKLDSIVVLYRQSDTLSLWGIPYKMRAGQSPRDLLRGQRERNNRDAYHRRHGLVVPEAKQVDADWIWLGTPSWFGSMTREQIVEVKAFLEKYKDSIPDWPGEWCDISSLKEGEDV